MRRRRGRAGTDLPIRQATPRTVDAYIATCSREVQGILREIRQTIRAAAPEAQESISYQMPTFSWNGALVYFAAFKKHIGFFPPVRGDARLVKAVAPYAGEKGNLRFPLEEPIPYDLIARITRLRVRQNRAKPGTRRRSRNTSSTTTMKREVR